MRSVALAVYAAVYPPYTVQRCSVACGVKNRRRTPPNTLLEKTDPVYSAVYRNNAPVDGGATLRSAPRRHSLRGLTDNRSETSRIWDRAGNA